MNPSRAMRVAVVVVALAAAAGCDRRSAQAPRPSPSEVLAEATGYYCGMRLAEHEGPKGQVYLASRSEPIWFSSVRDTIAFLRAPDEPRDIVAVYVNDMGRSAHWQQPDRGAWVDARQAWFVIESQARGGMGAPEAVPFSEQAAAEKFRASQGGRVVRLDQIPDDYLFGLPGQQADAPAAATH
ncbi:MAG TPA: nitrous oxide reductase accessory protein NosL [Burkholderiaceae bacterium]|nr:nitrous oxide reductase accessory protein NosL [Burkholderiaceae bacterium]